MAPFVWVVITCVFAVELVSVGSGCYLCRVEESESWSIRVGFHGANRSDHAPPLQVLFSTPRRETPRALGAPSGMKLSSHTGGEPGSILESRIDEALPVEVEV